mmetsp:Transcript_49226/g.154480  ORF Transcript_49226/g.154480 Transcript_49226/m.154480 type:complete len:86 (-) Transcript_49226:147-404(-)
MCECFKDSSSRATVASASEQPSKNPSEGTFDIIRLSSNVSPSSLVPIFFCTPGESNIVNANPPSANKTDLLCLCSYEMPENKSDT